MLKILYRECLFLCTKVKIIFTLPTNILYITGGLTILISIKIVKITGKPTWKDYVIDSKNGCELLLSLNPYPSNEMLESPVKQWSLFPQMLNLGGHVTWFSQGDISKLGTSEPETVCALGPSLLLHFGTQITMWRAQWSTCQRRDHWHTDHSPQFSCLPPPISSSVVLVLTIKLTSYWYR